MDREFTQYNIIDNIDRNILPFKKIKLLQNRFFFFFTYTSTQNKLCAD